MSFAILAVAAFLSVTGGADAAVTTTTVGADLSTPIAFAGICTSPVSCGAILLGATSPSTATVSPVEGTIRRWRVAGTTATPGYALSTVRREAGGGWTVTGATSAVTPAGSSAVETFSADLPVRPGEYLMLTIPEEGGISILESGSTEAYFHPAPVPGESATASEEEVSFTVAFDADIESRTPEPVTPVTPVAPITTPPVPSPVPICTVPKLAGKKLKAAKRAIRAADCRVGPVSKKKGVTAKTGKVVKQSPKPDKVLPARTGVGVRLG